MALDNLLNGDGSDNEENSDSDGLGSFLEKELSESNSGSDDAEVSYKPQIHFGSSETMPEVDDEEVDLIVTSPPYNTDWDYGSVDDDKDYATEYLPMMGRVFKECYRVLRPGGRMCVNVPSLLRSGASGGYPIAADITRMLVSEDGVTIALPGNSGVEIGELYEETDWIIREQIAWCKPFNHDGLAPNGSFPRPWGILLNNMHEVVMVFQKPGNRDYDDMEDQRIENSKINKTEQEMCDDVWEIQPDSWSPEYVDDEDIPVFPDKLARRCIQLWSYEGDTVMDPFAGRFTVGKVAKEENRHSIGYELREELRKDIEEYAGMKQSGLAQWS
jgi:site-specific DNA-methyltransferase (adenine-specific)